MPVIVNGRELADADIARELQAHADAAVPAQAALSAAVLRRVLLDEAARLELPAHGEEEDVIERLLEREVPASVPTHSECERQYLAQPERWRVGERARVGHILFQVTTHVDLAALRARAQQALDELLETGADIERRFPELARRLSNCPSSLDGGRLGEIGRGDTVPEFERAVFHTPAATICPTLVETEFGFHIVRLFERRAGHILPFGQVEARIRHAMVQARRDLAQRQYLNSVMGRASILGWKDGVAL